MKHSKKNRVRPADAPCKRPQTSDMYNRAFPVGNALFFFVGSVMSLFRLPYGDIFLRYFFMELFCSSPSLPLAVLIKFQVRSARFLPRYAALTCSLVSNSAPVPERVRVPVSST